MANMLCNYYYEKVKILSTRIPQSTRNPHRFLDLALESWEEKENRHIFEFRSISIVETLKLITDMGNSAALGHDMIDSQGIKLAASHLVHPIQHIINTSLSSGKFSRKWKLSRITPRLKGKDCDKLAVSSYRPVAVLPSISKLVE